ncbi:WD40 repeat domain-containing serine/threonine protein kinase [Actomonas aquatica]|uniref:WD40 repeat domain-containing serine/threonine protein kinase n=1 Tax=Actomonas aquatica TaxID=2866162 RepID=A0ABZ1C2W1_9BACT|nr:WD40 repeat domain-containing serine/threonine protein kinase [Opitutus sp. WL0086]WRQ85700.1 WD40 repeat domain-containing serine/threonine protein kinase [Opitutus sp. WL0086]
MPPEEANPTTPPPPLIPDYELLRRVGRGSYGDVWLARSQTGLFRAVKIVWRSRFTDLAPYEREFNGLREFARITAGESRQLSLLHVGRNETEGFFYYVMELADDVVTGREIDPGCYEPLTFRHFRTHDISPPIDEVIAHAIELAGCLAELHSTGHIHRDVKPSNIIVVHGHAKLADIGLVTHTSDALTYVGTEGFVPPEGPGTIAADIFSFGKVLYELATGRDRNDYPRLPENLGDRPDRTQLLELNEIILRACASRPEERYADVASLLADLQLLVAGRSVRRLRRAEAGLSRARRWIAIAAAIAAVASVGAYLERQRANVESAGRRAAEAELAARTRESLYSASIANAQRALSAGEYGLARLALADGAPAPGDPDLRGFEWFALHNEAAGDPAIILRESGPQVSRLSLSPDRRLVAVEDTSTTVQVIEIETGHIAYQLEGLHRVAGFSPDGQRLVGSTPDYELETWSLADGSPDPRPNQPGIFRPLFADATAPRLFYFKDSRDEAPHVLGIRNYNTDRDELTFTVPHWESDQSAWVFREAQANADLSQLALVMQRGLSPHTDFRLWFWHIVDGAAVLQFTRDSSDFPVLFDISADGSTFAYCIDQAENHFWAHGLPQAPWSGPAIGWEALSSAISPDGSKIVIGDRERKMLVYDSLTGAQLGLHRGHVGIPNASVWVDASRVISASMQGDVRAWTITASSGEKLHEFSLPPTTVATYNTRAVFEIDGGRVFLPSQIGQSMFFDLATGRSQTVPAELRSVLHFERGEYLWVDDQGRCWQSNTDTPSAPHRAIALLDPDEAFNHASISPDGHWILATSQRGQIVLWDRLAEEIVFKDRRPLAPAYPAINNHGHITYLSPDQILQTWDLLTNTLLAERKILWRPSALTVSPDGKWIVAPEGARGFSFLRAHDLSTALHDPTTYTMAITSAFHPDCRLFATAGALGTVRLFGLDDAGAWHERPPLIFADPGSERAQDLASRITFSPDGTTLIAHTRTGYLRIWRR